MNTQKRDRDSFGCTDTTEEVIICEFIYFALPLPHIPYSTHPFYTEETSTLGVRSKCRKNQDNFSYEKYNCKDWLEEERVIAVVAALLHFPRYYPSSLSCVCVSTVD